MEPPPSERKTKNWLAGPEAARFAVKEGEPYDFTGDDVRLFGVDGILEFEVSVVSARPLPAGTYEFNRNIMGLKVDICGYTITREVTATVAAPAGVLHELFFDPVTLGTAVTADATNGVLKPASFSGDNGGSATLNSISWESGTVKIGVSPDDALTGHVVDFIELDGTVSLTLDVADATVDAANETLSWTVTEQPWDDGDLLMVRIYDVAPTTCSDPSAPFGACNPTFSSPSYAFTVSEDAAVGHVVGSVSATSPKASATVTYSITAGNGDGKFAIDATTGEITTAGALDYETTAEYTLTVEARDGNNGAGTVTVQVLVGDVYEPDARCLNGVTVPGAEGKADLVRDCTYLLQFRDVLAGTGTLNWSGDVAITAWDGVRLTADEDAVAQLRLEAVGLTGSIPAALGNLTSLQRLDLDDNQLTGSIPAELGGLTNLQTLYLDNNQLTGSIPTELSNMASLRSLHLWKNQLTGKIPPELGGMASLTELVLVKNQLTGEIPVELGDLSSLTDLWLRDNQLTGTIPMELGDLTNLEHLVLSDNALTGSIPTALGISRIC